MYSNQWIWGCQSENWGHGRGLKGSVNGETGWEKGREVIEFCFN